jgi:hypothetical protein
LTTAVNDADDLYPAKLHETHVDPLYSLIEADAIIAVNRDCPDHLATRKIRAVACLHGLRGICLFEYSVTL